MSIILVSSPIIFCAALILVLLLRARRTVPKTDIKGKHIVITGGSKGIGRELALSCYKLGARVSILARNQNHLDEAKKYILEKGGVNEFSKVEVLSVDLAGDYAKVASAMAELEDASGPVFGLFNIAGSAVSQRLTETPIEDYHRMISANYISALNATKAVLETMVNQQAGFIQFTSSIAGLFGIYGYSAYAPSKFALLGFAETVQMELKLHNISVTIAFPPDTDTPGFTEEQKTKPPETLLISESGGLLQPNVVASKILEDTLSGKFASSVGLDGYLMKTLCAGMMPVNSFLDLLCQFLLMGIFRLAGAFYLSKFDRIIRKCALRREANKKRN